MQTSGLLFGSQALKLSAPGLIGGVSVSSSLSEPPPLSEPPDPEFPPPLLLLLLEEWKDLEVWKDLVTVTLAEKERAKRLQRAKRSKIWAENFILYFS